MSADVLTPIVERLEDGVKPPQGSEVVLLDRNTGGVIRGGLTSMLTPKVRLAITQDKVLVLPDQLIAVRNFRTNETTSVRCRLRLSVPSTPATAKEVAAHGLHGRKGWSPIEVLTDHIQNRLQAIIEASPNAALPILALIHAEHNAIVQRLAASMLAELGLRAEVMFQIDAVQTRDEFHLTSMFQVRCVDFPSEPRNLSVDIVLRRSGVPPTAAEPRDDAEWKSLIERNIQSIFHARVPLYWYWFRVDELGQFIKNEIDSVVRAYGRTVLTLQARPDTAPYAASEHVRAPVEWRGTSGKPVQFQVDARVHVEEHGLPRWRATMYGNRGADGYRLWLEDAVKRELPKALFGKDFTDITAETEHSLAALLWPGLHAAAETAGLKLESFVAKPEIAAADYLLGRETIIPSARYDTNNPSIPVQFEISVSWRVPDLNSVKRYLTPTDRLEAEVATTIREAAARVTRLYSPDFYAQQFDRTIDNFGMVFDQISSESRAVGHRYATDIMREEIREALQRLGGIEATRINFRRDDEPLRKVYEAIRRLPHILVTQTAVLQTVNGPSGPARLTAEWRVANIAPRNAWGALGVETFDSVYMRNLQSSLENWTRRVFDAIAMKSNLEQASRPDFQDGLGGLAREYVISQVERTFGLIVDLVHFKCEPLHGQLGYATRTQAALSFEAVDNQALAQRALAASSLDQQQGWLDKMKEQATKNAEQAGEMADQRALDSYRKQAEQAGRDLVGAQHGPGPGASIGATEKPAGPLSQGSSGQPDPEKPKPLPDL